MWDEARVGFKPKPSGWFRAYIAAEEQQLDQLREKYDVIIIPVKLV